MCTRWVPVRCNGRTLVYRVIFNLELSINKVNVLKIG
jgi:hypothetical protein